MGRSQKTGLLKLSQKLSALQNNGNSHRLLPLKEKIKKVQVGVVLGSPGAELPPNQCATRVLETPGLSPSQSVSPVGKQYYFPWEKVVNTAREAQSPALPLPATHCQHSYPEPPGHGAPGSTFWEPCVIPEGSLSLLGHVLYLSLPILTAFLT